MMTSLLLLCSVTFYSYTPTLEQDTLTVEPADRTCEVVESEEDAAWRIYRNHYYTYNDAIRWVQTIQRLRRYKRRSYALTVRLIEMGVIK